MFIEPLVAEDANIKNELDVPHAEFLQLPDGQFRSFGLSFEKELWADRLSVVLEQGRIYQHANGHTVAGMDNLDLGFKLAAYRNIPHEFILTPALFVTFPTGSEKVTERETALQPMLLFAKGLGELRPGWLRPFAIQGDIGYSRSVSGVRDRQLIYDLVLEYSIPYLNHFIRQADAGYQLEHTLRRGHSLRAIMGNLFPFVEFDGVTPVNGTPGPTSTFFRPGALYMGKYFQVSVAADVPVGSLSRPRHRVGTVFLLDLFLDEISPCFGWTPFGKKHPHHED